MINNVTLVGRLTKEIDLRYTQSGNAVGSFTLAVNRTFTNANGEKEADFINCVVWRKTAESMANYTKKGSLVGVIGRIQTRNYDNDAGQRIYITEVVAESIQFLEPKRDNQQNHQNSYSPSDNGFNSYQQSNNNNGQNNFNSNKNNYSNNFSDGSIDISDDDLPF